MTKIPQIVLPKQLEWAKVVAIKLILIDASKSDLADRINVTRPQISEALRSPERNPSVVEKINAALFGRKKA